MGRIRTVKPSFFKHEDLFDLEAEAGLPVRLSYIGLWTACDRDGRFVWRPRALKSDILPYDDIDFARVLDALTTRGFIVRYTVAGTDYGCIPSFSDHQVINNRETESKIPPPPQAVGYIEDLTRTARVNDASSTRHDHAQAEREREREEEDTEAYASDGVAVDPAKALFDAGVKVLGECGVMERNARSVLGKWRKDHPGQDGQILSAIMDCRRAGAVDPVPWITAKLKPAANKRIFDLSNFGMETP